MKTLVCILVILLQATNSKSQPANEIDSLTKLSRNHSIKDKRQLSNINARLGWLFQQCRQFDSSLYFYERALEFPENESKRDWVGQVHLGIGTTYLHLDLWDSSFKHLEKSLSIFKTLGDTNNLAIAYSNIAILYGYRNLYDEALAAALQMLPRLENTSPSFALASRYNLIGSIHKHIGNYSDAQSYYRKALSIRIAINQPLEIAKSYNNLGELFILTHQYDSARRNLMIAAEMKRELGDQQGLARTLTRLGKVLILTGDNSGAHSHLLESLHTQQTIDDPVGMIETLNNLGELYLNTNKLTQADETLREANTIIHRSGTPEYLKQNLELRIRLARHQKDFANGMTLLEELIIIRDSLLNEEKSKTLQAMQIRYETQKKEQEIALLEQQQLIHEAQIRNNRILIGALVIGLALLAAIGILIYINLKTARAAKQRFELLLAETRHRIKNNLQTLASIFHLQTRHYTNQELVLEAQTSESRVHAMSLLHEQFYSSETDHIVGTREYITDLVHKLVNIYGAQTSNLNLSLKIDNINLDVDKALALSLIIQELVCNAFKYAFDHEPDPELTIELHYESDHATTIVRDNGIGFAGEVLGSSQGLNLVDALVGQLDGTMQVDNQHGTTFTISFPVTSLWKKPAF